MNADSSPIDKPKLAYNLEEAAEATGYSVSTLRIAIRRHDLIARYANTKPVILPEELLDWLRSLPTEPKGGHQSLSYLDGDVEGWPGPPAQPQRTPKPPAKAVFRTPEEVAAELGMSKSTLRHYCKASGVHTRLGRNRLMLHEDDIPRLVAWIREQVHGPVTGLENLSLTRSASRLTR
jgi:AraC-like DNA-binding protein